jgi:hydrogenase maturation protease
MNAGSQRILIMGVGNPLMRDDGIGPRVVEMLLTGYTFPDNVEVVDAGTMSFMILDMLRGIDDLILIDAMQDTGTVAGTVVVMTPDEIAPNQVKHSMHDVGIVDVLQAAELMDRAPATVAVGVQIESIEQWVLELSAPVATSIPIAAAAVLDELKKLGVEPIPNAGVDVHAQIISALRTYAPMPDTTTLADGS